MPSINTDRAFCKFGLTVNSLNFYFFVFLTGLYIHNWIDFPPDVDPLAFYAALTDYDVSAGRPHAPGYPLYVGLGKVAALIVPLGNAYALVNLAFIVIGAWGTYAGLASRGWRRAAWFSAPLLASHPLVLSTALSSETYFADAAFSALVFGLTGTLKRRPFGFLVALFAAVLALATVRAVSAVLITPMILACAWWMVEPHQRPRFLVKVLLVVGTAVVSAYAITVTAADGPAAYRAAVEKVMVPSFQGASVLGGAPLQVHAGMVVKLLVWLICLATPFLLAFLFSGHGLFRRISKEGSHTSNQVGQTELMTILIAWIIAPLLFYAAIYYLKPSYQLIYLPALMAALGWALNVGRFKNRPAFANGAVVILICAQLAFFEWGTASLPTPLYRLTRAYLQHMDDASHRLTDFVNQQDPKTSLIVWVSHADLRVFSLRLIDSARHAASYDSASHDLQEIRLHDMTWSPATSSGLNLPNIRSIALISAVGPITSLRSIPIKPGTPITADLIQRMLVEHQGKTAAEEGNR